jgi:hypothetical protein
MEEEEEEKEIIYIISVEYVIEKKIEILDIFYDRLLAIEYILKHIKSVNSKDNLTVFNDDVFYVSSQQVGYLYNSESLQRKYLIHPKIRLQSGNIVDLKK